MGDFMGIKLREVKRNSVSSPSYEVAGLPDGQILAHLARDTYGVFYVVSESPVLGHDDVRLYLGPEDDITQVPVTDVKYGSRRATLKFDLGGTMGKFVARSGTEPSACTFGYARTRRLEKLEGRLVN